MPDLAHKINTLMQESKLEEAISDFYDDRLKSISSWFNGNNREHLNKNTFLTLVHLIPNWQVIVPKLHGSYSKSYINYVLSEVFSIYASVMHNAGIHYGVEDVPQISEILAHTFFGEAMPSIQAQIESDNDPDKDRLREFTREYIGPIAVYHDGNVLLKFTGSDSVEQQVVEFRRQTNIEKEGFAKYRIRETTYKRQLEPQKVFYSPLPGWVTEEWITRPSDRTIRMRNCIKSLIDYLISNRTPAFSVSEGGAFKGTVTDGTDIDTWVYVLDNMVIDEEVLQNYFAKLMHEQGVHFKREGLGYVRLTPIPKGQFLPLEIRKYEEGFLIYDGKQTRYLRTDGLLDLNHWKNTLEAKIIPNPSN